MAEDKALQKKGENLVELLLKKRNSPLIKIFKIKNISLDES